MHFGQVVSVWINGTRPDAQDKSDQVENIHTAHPDEPLPDGTLLNSVGHHSFYVVFQRTRKGTTVANGVIRGQVDRGQGHRIRLLHANQVVAEQALDESLSFKFENLPFGVYRLEIVDTDVIQDNIKLDANNTDLTINLAVPPPDNSVIFGEVKNGQGRMLLLVKENSIIARFPLPDSGQFRFENLASGNYSLTVFETGIKQDNIVLDGTNSRSVILTVPEATETEKIMNHYLLFGPPNSRGRQTNLLLAVDYILAFSPAVGFSVEEAKQARQVTIIGEGISPTEQQAITDSGSQVEVLTGDAYDIEAKLRARIQTGRAFGD
jgi:hypothetical protein